MAEVRPLILSLLKCDVLKIGNFKLKSGEFSPIYIDLRRIIHYPKVMKDIVVAIRMKLTEENLNTDTVCGVPYTAIPIASVFSTCYNIPMVLKRKEAKDYGTKRLVEGAFKTGDSCLLLEDVVCSGTSVKDTADALRKEGLIVRDCVVIVDKQQGGIANLKKIGLNLYSLFNIEAIFNTYCSINRIESELIQKITSYLKDNPYMPIYEGKNYADLSYAERSEIIDHPMAKRLLQIMDKKNTNLCVAISTSHCEELITFAEQLGPHICLLKTHVDILSDFSEKIINQLTALSSLHNFLILEDRKFVDIGQTVIQQYKGGIYKIEKWADLVTVYGTCSNDTIEALKSCVNSDKRACIIELHDAFSHQENQEKAFQIANNHTDFVIGYTAQIRHQKGKNMICLSRSIKLSPVSDSHSNNYKLLENVIEEGADIIIAEIDVNTVDEAVAPVIDCKTRCFKAYLNRII